MELVRRKVPEPPVAIGVVVRRRDGYLFTGSCQVNRGVSVLLAAVQTSPLLQIHRCATLGAAAGGRAGGRAGKAAAILALASSPSESTSSPPSFTFALSPSLSQSSLHASRAFEDPTYRLASTEKKKKCTRTH